MVVRAAIVAALLSAGGVQLPAQTLSFASHVYPVLEAAGCRNCHYSEGVASPTRLHFPEEGIARDRVEAFGLSLVEFVDRNLKDKSLLLLKPTARIGHAGGEKIAKGSPEETVLRGWVDRLVTLSDSELSRARNYRKEEAAGYGAAPKAVLRRLTHAQYNNTVRDLLKDTSEIANTFPPEDYVNGFTNQYVSLSISPLLADAYGTGAEKLAANAFRRGDSRGLLPCKPASETDATCRSKFVETFGMKAFRRPLEREESARYTAIFRKQPTFLKGAQAVIEAMLQSPSFLFWMEETPNPKWKPYAKASFLSFFLWNTTPDEMLLASARNSELETAQGMERVARRMLDHPKAHDGINEFTAQWLRFDRVIAASRERRLFPLFNAELARSMTEETRRFVSDLVWSDRNFMTVFTAGYSFVNSDLAAIYKIPPPPRDFDRVNLPAAAERAGILGHASLLTLTSKPDDTAPTGRGLFVREQFLCQQVPPPPPGVDTNLPPVEESKPVTNRERLAMHTTNAMCSGCHALIDPVGFAFERFDAIGMHREKHKLRFFPAGSGVAARRTPPKEIELEIDSKGWIAGLPDSSFASPRQLGELLARTPQCQECVVKQVFRYMAGRQDTPADRAAISSALNEFRKSDFRFRELMVSLVKFKSGGAIHAAGDH